MGLLSVSSVQALPLQKVCITQFVDHPALNETRRGIIDGLAREGYKDKENIILMVQSAQANPSLASQIATTFVSQDPDVVVGISTLSGQTLYQAAKGKSIPVIFSSVTDPVKANLVKELNRPGRAVSGMSNFVDILPQILLFKEIQPNLKVVGFLYNPSEANSRVLLAKLQQVCQQEGIKVISKTAFKTSDVSQSASALAEQVDAIFISNDSTALAALPAIIRAATQKRIPVYVSDTDAVAQGALAALGPNQYKLGLQTAQFIIQALKGKDVSAMPVGFPTETELYVNQQVAKQLGIPLSEHLLTRATKIIKEPTSSERGTK